MTAQEIIKQTEKLSPDEQKSLISFLVLRQLNPEKKEQFANLFHYKKQTDSADDVYNSIVAEQFLNGYNIEKPQTKDWSFFNKFKLSEKLNTVNIRDYAYE